MLARAAKVGLVVGVVLVAAAAFSLFTRTSPTPTCDGRQMSATDKCITHYADGHTVTQDYAQAKGHDDSGLTWVLLIGGVTLGGASLAGWQLRRGGYRLGEAA